MSHYEQAAAERAQRAAQRATLWATVSIGCSAFALRGILDGLGS